MSPKTPTATPSPSSVDKHTRVSARFARQQSGFTLVELIVVIIILGILSASAIPRFTGLLDSAKKATLTQHMAEFKAQIRSMNQHARILAANEPLLLTHHSYDTNKLLPSGQTIRMVYGYPRAEWSTGIGQLLNPDGDWPYVVGSNAQCQPNNGAPYCHVKQVRSADGSAWSLVILPAGTSVNDNCHIRYLQRTRQGSHWRSPGTEHLPSGGFEAVLTGC